MLATCMAFCCVDVVYMKQNLTEERQQFHKRFRLCRQARGKALRMLQIPAAETQSTLSRSKTSSHRRHSDHPAMGLIGHLLRAECAQG